MKRCLILLSVCAFLLASGFYALARLPEWVGAGSDIEASCALLIHHFEWPAFVALLLISFSVLQCLGSLLIRAILELDRIDPKLSLDLRGSPVLRGALLFPMILGLQLLYVWICFGSLSDWKAWVVMLLGFAFTRTAGYGWRTE